MFRNNLYCIESPFHRLNIIREGFVLKPCLSLVIVVTLTLQVLTSTKKDRKSLNQHDLDGSMSMTNG